MTEGLSHSTTSRTVVRVLKVSLLGSAVKRFHSRIRASFAMPFFIFRRDMPGQRLLFSQTLPARRPRLLDKLTGCRSWLSCTVTAEKPSAMVSALLNLLTYTDLLSAGLRALRTAPDTTAGMSAILFRPITASTTRPISAALSDTCRRISASAAAMSFSQECPTVERCATRWPRSTLRLSPPLPRLPV